MESTRFWNSTLNVEFIAFNMISFYFLFLFSLSSKISFCSFQFFAKGHSHNVVSMLINVVKLNVENNSIVLTLPNLANITVDKCNVDSTLFNVRNFDFDKHIFDSTLIWRCLTSRRHISLIKTLKPHWMLLEEKVKKSGEVSFSCFDDKTYIQ